MTGTFDLGDMAGAVAESVAGSLVAQTTFVDRGKLRESAKEWFKAADALEDLHRRAKAGLDGSASGHPGWEVSAALTEVAECWRVELDRIAGGVSGFAQAAVRSVDGYDQSEYQAVTELTNILHILAGR